MGFLPFVNRNGHRVVRWHRLIVAWIFILAATLFGSCALGFILVGDWSYGVLMGLVTGVAFSAAVTVFGFTTPVENLPLIQPEACSGARTAPGSLPPGQSPDS